MRHNSPATGGPSVFRFPGAGQPLPPSSLPERTLNEQFGLIGKYMADYLTGEPLLRKPYNC